MAQIQASSESLKQALKEALFEQREFLHEIFAEVLEDFALAEAIREGLETKIVERNEVMQTLKARS